VDLSPTEYRLLHFLITNVGKVLSRWQILDHVWDYGYEGDPTIVESYVSQLRKKIDTSPPSIIRTVRSIGYRIERPDAGVTLRARLTSAAALVVVVSFFLGLFLITQSKRGDSSSRSAARGFLPSKPFRIATSSGPTSRPATRHPCSVP